MAVGWQRRRRLAADFVMSFLWIWWNAIIKIFVRRVLGYGADEAKGKIIRYALSILNLIFFALMGKVSNGGAYNPLTILSPAVSGNFSNFLFTLGARIPAQVVGSVYGVRLVLSAFPGIVLGPRLNVDVAKGALTEGLLAFAMGIISLGLARKAGGSFFMKTWISSLSKIILHILGSDLTGGCMNPASAMGWAFSREEHIMKEHLVVYWLAPVEATLIAVWVFGILFGPTKDEALAAKKDAPRQLKSEKTE